MAPFAGAICFGNVYRMAECDGPKTFNCVRDVSRFAAVTAGTVLFVGDTECLYTAMACTAGFSFLHFGHSVAFFVSQVEDRIVAYSAIIIVLFQVKLVTEHDRLGVFELEFDVLGFGRTGAGDRQHAYRNG